MATSEAAPWPRSQMLCAGAPATHLSEHAELHSLLPEYVAPAGRRESLHNAFRANAYSHALCRPSLGARDQRLRVLGIRGGSCCGDGWAGRMGSHVDLAWSQWAFGTCLDHSVSRFA